MLFRVSGLQGEDASGKAHDVGGGGSEGGSSLQYPFQRSEKTEFPRTTVAGKQALLCKRGEGETEGTDGGTEWRKKTLVSFFR